MFICLVFMTAPLAPTPQPQTPSPEGVKCSDHTTWSTYTHTRLRHAACPGAGELRPVGGSACVLSPSHSRDDMTVRAPSPARSVPYCWPPASDPAKEHPSARSIGFVVRGGTSRIVQVHVPAPRSIAITLQAQCRYLPPTRSETKGKGVECCQLPHDVGCFHSRNHGCA